MRNYNYEVAFIPLPLIKGLISRKLVKQKRKWKLNGYNFPEDIEEPNFGLIYNLLPDNHVPGYFSPQNQKEKEDFQKALSSNKIKWFKLILEYEPLNTFVPQISLPEYCHSKKITAVTTQPLIVGLGEPSPYETGITLDFLTGLPVIPGSALKGITRRAAIMILSGKMDILPYGEEFQELANVYDNHDKVAEIFGTQDKKGKVIFMDAYPFNWSEDQNKRLFRIDIMNPHYGPYYETKGKEPPADWYNPVPIPYLTVNTGVRYRFVIASKDKNLLSKAVEWLAFALTNIGVGAKGSQGYGVFKIEGEISNDKGTN